VLTQPAASANELDHPKFGDLPQRHDTLPKLLKRDFIVGLAPAGSGSDPDQSPYTVYTCGGELNYVHRGLRPEAIGMVLAAGTAVRLAAGPAAGRLADRLDAAKLVFAGCAAAATLMAILYLPTQGFWPLFAVSLLQAAALAPLCDTLALGAAAPARRDDAGGPGFDYGWARCRLRRLYCRVGAVRASRRALRHRRGHLAQSRWSSMGRVPESRFAPDSSLEERAIELPVPLANEAVSPAEPEVLQRTRQ
jgi:hypothetical protein